jgi:hypothetical protein
LPPRISSFIDRIERVLADVGATGRLTRIGEGRQEAFPGALTASSSAVTVSL